MGDVPPTVPDPVKKALEQDTREALRRERDELREKLCAHGARECPSCRARIVKGDVMPPETNEEKKAKKGKKAKAAPAEPKDEAEGEGAEKKKDGKGYLDVYADMLCDDEEE